jgi:hypothetical protein
MEDGPLEGDAQERTDKAGGEHAGMAEELRVRAELERCNQEQREIAGMGEKPLWLLMLGHADWEAEKELIRREVGGCSVSEVARMA